MWILPEWFKTHILGVWFATTVTWNAIACVLILLSGALYSVHAVSFDRKLFYSRIAIYQICVFKHRLSKESSFKILEQKKEIPFLEIFKGATVEAESSARYSSLC